jgi:hypothetical protein
MAIIHPPYRLVIRDFLNSNIVTILVYRPFLVACTFGGVRLATWNSFFPTQAEHSEQTIWRVSFEIFSRKWCDDWLGKDPKLELEAQKYKDLVGLAFFSLRVLSYDQYMYVPWTLYIPISAHSVNVLNQQRRLDYDVTSHSTLRQPSWTTTCRALRLALY